MSLPEPQAFSDLTEMSLQDLRVAAHNRAANLRKAVIRDMEMWVEQWSLASLASWMLEHRKDLNIREKQTQSIVSGMLPEEANGGRGNGDG